MMNIRLEAYLTMHPGHVLKSKPDTPPKIDEDVAVVGPVRPSLSRSGSVLSRSWNKGRKISFRGGS